MSSDKTLHVVDGQCHISTDTPPFKTLCGQVRGDLNFVSLAYFKKYEMLAPAHRKWCTNCREHEVVQLWLLTQI